MRLDGIRRILCPIDFSGCARGGLDMAIGAGTRTRSAIVFGDVAAGIIDHAAAWPADLVIMGSHGQGAREGLSIGSVADQVVRGAPCAVLLVPTSAADRSLTPAFRRVLRLSRQRDVDLIVMGVHARRRVDRRLPETTVSHVLRAASCPVLAARPDVKQERTQTAFATR